MSGVVRGRERSLERASARVAERLRARRSEIEQAIFDRVREATFGHVGEEDAEYVAGLRTAVAAAVELSITGIERGDGPALPVPREAIEQAHRAAHLGVSLDTVLRRYIAGQALLADFIMEEADRSGLSGRDGVLHHHLRSTQTPLLERLTASIVDQYNRELEGARRSPEQRRAEFVLRTLAGEQLHAAELAELDYDFEAWHIGIIATGERVAEALRGLKAAQRCELLTVLRSERTIWVWLSWRGRPAAADVKRLSVEWPPGFSLAMGEPRRGVEGWRLTHEEAKAALLIARRKPPGLTRCSDVMLEAAVLQHKTLVTALVATYLWPLDDLRYRGQTARDTLRAYFEARRNVSSAANRLGVVRNTVESRLREIEERLGRPLHTCSAQLEVALRLEALGDSMVTENQEPPDRIGRINGGAILSVTKIEQSAQSSSASLSTLISHS